jgi:hypothetical protein
VITSLRRQTSRICCIVCACLLFTQLAVAAYACPKQEIPTTPAAAIADEPAGMPEGCAALDPVNPNLCLQHCQGASQLPDGSSFVIPAPEPLPLVYIALPARPVLTSLTVAYASELLARNTAPPLNVRNCCFRI